MENTQSGVTSHLNKVEGLQFVLLSWRQRAQHLVDVCHAPHRGAQEGWGGEYAGTQDIQQVPDPPLVELEEKLILQKKTCERPQHLVHSQI